VSNLAVFLCYAAYCWKNYDICRVGLRVDKSYLKSMSAFFSWNLFGAVANISKQQGLNLLLNVFCGVVLNATWGIATQVSAAVGQFTASFQQAFNPQILKSYSNGDKSAFHELLQSCSKYSFLLIWLVSLPILLQTEFLLKLWLGNTLPDYAVLFTQMAVLYIVIDALSGPLWVAVQATGNIKRYQIELSILVSVSFISSWVALALGASACFVAIVNVVVNMLCHLYRLYYLHKKIDFPMAKYYVKVLIPAVLTGAVGYISGICTQQYAGKQWYSIIGYLAAVTVFNVIVMAFAGLSGTERKLLKSYIVKKLSKKTV
jgi:O-antigen/teichoic acid export membrane protein